MSAARIVRLGPSTAELYIDGHQIENVQSVDVASLSKGSLQESPLGYRVTLVFDATSIAMEPVPAKVQP